MQLEVRATDYNRFREKMTVHGQIFWGNTVYYDYPDAENFLLLLYGPTLRP